jgi:hypothetical protein
LQLSTERQRQGSDHEEINVSAALNGPVANGFRAGCERTFARPRSPWLGAEFAAPVVAIGSRGLTLPHAAAAPALWHGLVRHGEFPKKFNLIRLTNGRPQ